MKRILLTTALALTVSACTITPKPLTTGAISSFATDKLSRVTAGQEPVSNAITLHEAMARALKYNLDFHVELYNEALAAKQLANARLDTLPNLVASAGYTGRNNDSGTTGTTTLPDRNRFEEDITLSWNILDFGLSKIRAEQAADEVLIARETRRKIINRIIEDVRTAYWRAVSADRLVVGLRKLEDRTERAYQNSKALQRDGETSPLTALTYQRELVEIQQRIQRLEKDLSLAKIQLSALMNVRPNEHYTLAQPKRRADSTSLKMSNDEMVFAALENRPELRDIQYKLRINAKESKIKLLQLLPGINVFAGQNFNSDSQLLNGNWIGWGAKATLNLLNIFKYPTQKRLIEGKDEVLDARALAVTMAIMTQVHVSRVRYMNSKKLYRTAAKHLGVQRGILKQIRASSSEGLASEQTLIREEMNTLVSQVSADIAYADLQNSFANIFASMGIDPYADDLKANDNIASLSESLRKVWIERGDMSGAAYRAKRSAKSGKIAHGTTSKKVEAPKVIKAHVSPPASAGGNWKKVEQNGAVKSIAPKRTSFWSKLKAAAKSNSANSNIESMR